MKKNTKYNDAGQALVLTVLLLAVILAIALAISNVFVVEIRLAGDVTRSVQAIMAADSGIEWMLYKERKTETGDDEPTEFNGNDCRLNNDCLLANDAFFTATKESDGQGGTNLVSIGTFGGIKRGLRVRW